MKILISSVKDFEVTKMKLSSINTVLVCLFFILSFSACVSISENKSKNSRFENRDFSNKPVNLNNAEERQKFEEISREFEKYRNLWKEKNIFDYDFICERHVEGVGGDFTVMIEVRNNKALPIKDIKRFQFKDINDFPYYKEINAIEKQFDYVQRMLEEGYSVSVIFNNQYGFPEEIGIKTEGNGWISIKIKQFQIVNKL